MAINRHSRAKKSLSNISKSPMKSPSKRIKAPMKSPSTRITTPMKSPSKRSDVSKELEEDSGADKNSGSEIEDSGSNENSGSEIEDSGANENSGSEIEDSGANENSGSENEGSITKKKNIGMAEETPSKRSKSATDQKTKTPIKEVKKAKKETASPAKKAKTAAKNTAKPKAKVEKKKAMSRELEKDSEVSGSETSENEVEESKNKKRSKRAAKNKKEIDENKEVKLIVCKICKKEFGLYAALVRHQKVHNALNVLKCTICKEKLESRPAYTNHMNREHPNIKAYPCVFPDCEESFQTQKKRRDHEKSHLRYTCQFCKKGFKQSFMMRAHVQKVHY